MELAARWTVHILSELIVPIKSFWADVDKWAKFAEILGIVAGGIAVYYRFFKDRIYEGRLEVSLDVAETKHEGVSYIGIVATIKNIGASRLDVIEETTAVSLYSCDGYPADYISAPWDHQGTFRMFSGRLHLEAGETAQDQHLVLIPGKTGRCHMAELEVHAGKSYWILRYLMLGRQEEIP